MRGNNFFITTKIKVYFEITVHCRINVIWQRARKSGKHLSCRFLLHNLMTLLQTQKYLQKLTTFMLVLIEINVTAIVNLCCFRH